MDWLTEYERMFEQARQLIPALYQSTEVPENRIRADLETLQGDIQGFIDMIQVEPDL